MQNFLVIRMTHFTAVLACDRGYLVFLLSLGEKGKRFAAYYSGSKGGASLQAACARPLTEGEGDGLTGAAGKS